MQVSTKTAFSSKGRKRRAWDKRVKSKSRIALQSRDMAIIRAVYEYRFLTTSQIAQMFFSSKSKAISRLRALYDAKYLDRILRPAISGKSELIYALARKGATILSEDQTTDDPPINWTPKRNRVKPEFLNHELAVNEVRFSFEKYVTANSSNLLFWKYDYDLRSEFGKKRYLAKVDAPIDYQGSSIIVNPDSYFGLMTPKGRTYFFLELDRSTETKERVFKRKLLGYRLYFEQGFFKEHFGHNFFRVLTVTLTKRRRDSLLEAAEDICEKLGLLFWFSTLDEVKQHGPFVAIWRNVSEGNLTQLI